MTTLRADLEAMIAQRLCAWNHCTEPCAYHAKQAADLAALTTHAAESEAEAVAYLAEELGYLPGDGRRELWWKPNPHHVTWKQSPLYLHPAAQVKVPELVSRAQHNTRIVAIGRAIRCLSTEGYARVAAELSEVRTFLGSLNPGSQAAGEVGGSDLRGALQQKCSGWGVYWRAPDDHGVSLTTSQAMELLRDAVGVDVEITDARA